MGEQKTDLECAFDVWQDLMAQPALEPGIGPDTETRLWSVMMDDASARVLILFAMAYVVFCPLGLALLLHWALRSQRFQRRHALIGIPLVGALMRIGSVLALSIGSPGEIPLLGLVLWGSITAGLLLAIVYVWTAHSEHFWGTALFAGLVTTGVGPLGNLIAMRIAMQAGGLLFIDLAVPLFISGTLTHIFLRRGVPSGQVGYYDFSCGRVFLVLLFVPIPALLSWCSFGLR